MHDARIVCLNSFCPFSHTPDPQSNLQLHATEPHDIALKARAT